MKKRRIKGKITSNDIVRTCSSIAVIMLLIALIIHLCAGYSLASASILLILLFANLICLLCLIFMDTKKK